MRILIIGFGCTGRAVYEFLKEGSDEIFLYDEKPLSEDVYTYARLKKELPMFDLGIKSPGIRPFGEAYALLKILCREIVSEIDFAFGHLKTRHIIGVTGSNGKTTLVTFLGHMIERGRRAYLAGNIGVPLISLVHRAKEEDYILLELSSFQMEDCRMLKAERIYFTSLCPNHLNQYASYEHYCASKKRAQFFSERILCLGEENPFAQAPSSFDGEDALPKCIIGSHNRRYARCAIAFAREIGIPEPELQEQIRTLTMVKYRLEEAGRVNNLRFVNDSKSTSSDASAYAYATFYGSRIILILGGIHKSDSFAKIPIRPGDRVMIYGRDRDRIAAELPGETYETLADVVRALKSEREESLVLFSPGCDSHDQFRSYIDRGETLNRLIAEILMNKKAA